MAIPKTTADTNAGQSHRLTHCIKVYIVIRDLKQIATAGADTAAGSKFPPK